MKPATVMFNGSLYRGVVVRTAHKRALVKFTTGTGWEREKWFTIVPRPEGTLVGRRGKLTAGFCTIPPNSVIIENGDIV